MLCYFLFRFVVASNVFRYSFITNFFFLNVFFVRIGSDVFSCLLLLLLLLFCAGLAQEQNKKHETKILNEEKFHFFYFLCAISFKQIFRRRASWTISKW